MFFTLIEAVVAAEVMRSQYEADAQAALARQQYNEQLKAYAEAQANEPLTIDLPPDAVREIKDVPLLESK
jgi:hypothetical protein